MIVPKPIKDLRWLNAAFAILCFAFAALIWFTGGRTWIVVFDLVTGTLNCATFFILKNGHP